MTRAGGARLGVALIGLAVLGMQGTAAADDDRRTRSLRATLSGYEESPAVSSTGHGRFEAKISQDEESFDYKLNFADLEGVVTQSHIHVAQPGVNGGIAVWLCGSATNPGPANTPDCGGPNSGSAMGTITAANVIGPAGQGIAAGEFAELLKAMRAGVAYVNVHSNRNPGGEIRGQLRPGGDRD